jgi:STE24 endopeptidase
MGHYVLNHAFKLTVYLTLLFGIAFVLLHLVFERALARFGPRLGLRNRADPAALPLAIAIFSVVSFVLMPMSNTIIRNVEAEADAFGLNAAREPEGFAMAAMRLSTYRKIKPGAVEEFLFYDHPSGYDRVHRAMIWLKENLPATPPRAGNDVGNGAGHHRPLGRMDALLVGGVAQCEGDPAAGESRLARSPHYSSYRRDLDDRVPAAG